MQLIYYGLLYYHKDEIKERGKHVIYKGRCTEYKLSAALTFLYAEYETKFWYWEVVESTRKLMLTALFSVISPSIGVKVRSGLLNRVILLFYEMV